MSEDTIFFAIAWAPRSVGEAAKKIRIERIISI